MPSRRPPLAGFTHQEPTCERFVGGGKLETICRAPAVWTLAHRGYSGGGRLDVWVYPDRSAAELAGAELTLLCGIDDLTTRALFDAGDYAGVIARYEAAHSDEHVMRGQAAFLQPVQAHQHSPGCLERHG